MDTPDTTSDDIILDKEYLFCLDRVLDRVDIVSVSDFLNTLIIKLVDKDASDIHIDPTLDSVNIRIRLRGAMSLFCRLDISLHEELIGRIKILSKLRTDIHEGGQDGRFAFQIRERNRNEDIDIRVSILPTFFGENAVLRILRPYKNRNMSFRYLGMLDEQIRVLESALEKQQGIILVVGPTGSGKTTTIYSMIHHISGTGRNIITIEDPIEYVIPEVRQVQVRQGTKLSFVDALRGVVRQDPDVIVIGEIRDSETAQMAFRSALTGHLVISTLHAEDTAGVYARLVDMSVSSQSMDIIRLVISQRIVNFEKEDHDEGTEEGALLREAIYEVVEVTDNIAPILFSEMSPLRIRKRLINKGNMLLKEALSQKTSKGYTCKENNFLPNYE